LRRSVWDDEAVHHKTPNLQQPGRYRQRTLRRNPRYSLLPLVAIALLLVLLAWEVLRKNLDLRMQGQYPWRLTFLGVDTTATLAAVLIGLIVARGQFVRTVRPTIGYSTRAAAGELLNDPGGEGWTVRLYNGGPGTASIQQVDYWCQSRREEPSRQEWMSLARITHRLADLGLTEGQDYALHWLGEGALVPAGATGRLERDGVEMLSFRSKFREELCVFDIRVRVVDIAGDLHERVLGCIFRLFKVNRGTCSRHPYRAITWSVNFPGQRIGAAAGARS